MRNIVYARDANGQVMAIYEREFNPMADNNPHGKLKFKLKLEWFVHGCVGWVELEEGVNFIIDTVTNSIIITADIQGVVAPCNHAFVLQQGTSILLDPPFNEKEEQWGWGGYRQYNQSNSKSYKTPKAITLLVNGNPVSMQIKEINVGMSYSNPEFLPKLAEWHVYGNEQQGRFLTKFPEIEPTHYGVEIAEDVKNNIFSRQLGKKAYELKDHLGNVRVTFSDIKMPTGSGSQPFRVDLLSKSEYYPYGMKISDLSYNATGARYGYNSQEQSTELNLDGNHTTAEFWEYDARSARRWNLDPVDQISKSNYATFGNNPIMYNDLNGDDPGLGMSAKISRNKAEWKSFFSNSKKLNTKDYGSINSKYSWYLRASQFAKTKIETKWFNASSDVVAPFSVGMLDANISGLKMDVWALELIVKQETNDFLYNVANAVHKFNMNFVNEMYNKGTLNGTKSGGFANDLSILGKEQLVVQGVIDNLGTKKDGILEDYNTTFNTLIKDYSYIPGNEYLKIAKSALGVKKLDFGNYQHRVAIGVVGLRLQYDMDTDKAAIMKDVNNLVNTNTGSSNE